MRFGPTPDQPAEQLASAVGHITSDVLWIEIKGLGGALDHGRGRLDLLGDVRRCGFDIDNDRILHVDEIVEAMAEHDLFLIAPSLGEVSALLIFSGTRNLLGLDGSLSVFFAALSSSPRPVRLRHKTAGE